MVKRFGIWSLCLVVLGSLRCGTGIETLKTKVCTPNGDFAVLDDFVYSTGKDSFATKIRPGLGGYLLGVGKGVFSDDKEHWITRLSQDGGSVWETVDDFNYVTNNNSGANDVIVDSSGNYLSVGYGTSGGFTHWVVRRSVDTGLTWATVDDYQLAAGGNAVAQAIVVHGNGDIYVSGFAFNTTSHWITRLSEDAGVTWTTVDDYQFQSAQNSRANGIAVDPSGSLFSIGSGVASGETHWIVRKLINAGTEWTTVDDFVLSDATFASASAIAINSSGVLFVTGQGSDGTVIRGLTRKSVNNGVAWTTVDNFNYTRTDDSTIVGDTVFSAIALDGVGNPYVTGYGGLASGTGESWLVRKSTTSGTVWDVLSAFQVPGGTSSEGTGLFFDSSGSLYSSGFGDDPTASRWILRRAACSN